MTPKIARCARGKCRRRPRENGRYCALCHAAANRRSHRKHRKERNARRRDRAKNRDEVARARDSARAKLYVAIARGTVIKGVCRVCHRHANVVAHIADTACWRDAVWFCREHRYSARETNATRPVSKAPTWINERDAALAAIALLSKEERAALYEIAAVGPAGVRLDPAAPLFSIQLVRAYRRRRRSGAGP